MRSITRLTVAHSPTRSAARTCHSRTSVTRAASAPDSHVVAAPAVPVARLRHQAQSRHVPDPAPHDAALLRRQQQVQRVRVFGGVLRVVASQAHDRHGGEFALHLCQPALVRREPRRGAVDRLRQHLLVDRLAVGVERARADPLGRRELVLFDQGPHPFPGGDAAVCEQRFGERQAAFARRVTRVGEQLPRFACVGLGLLIGRGAIARQRHEATQLAVVGVPDELCRLAVEAGEVARARQAPAPSRGAAGRRRTCRRGA